MGLRSLTFYMLSVRMRGRCDDACLHADVSPIKLISRGDYILVHDRCMTALLRGVTCTIAKDIDDFVFLFLLDSSRIVVPKRTFSNYLFIIICNYSP